jgi:LPXTG-motif cell wall-anchored protein
VTDETDGTVDPDADFLYKITINEANNEDIYFSVFGTNGAQYLTPEQGVIVSGNVTPTIMVDNGVEHQYYVAKSGEEFTVNAKAGWSLMFLNLPNGTTYTINEYEMPAGFEFEKEEGSAIEYYYATPNDPSTRTTRPVATNMDFDGTVTTGSITLSNTQYRVDYTNKWISKDVTLIKVNDEGDEIGGAEFDISKKNAAGSFESVATFISSTEDDVVGEVFKLGYGSYCLTETKAPDGHIILTNKIYFNLTTDGIILCDENGNAAEYENAVVSGVDQLTITIENTPGQQLPLTGGPGTFLYTLSGMTLILASALLYGFRLRRRERRLK